MRKSLMQGREPPDKTRCLTLIQTEEAQGRHRISDTANARCKTSSDGKETQGTASGSSNQLLNQNAQEGQGSGKICRHRPEQEREAGPTTLRDILSAFRALAGGRYRVPRLTSPTAPSAPSPTLPERTKTQNLVTEPGAGDAPGRLLRYQLWHPRPVTTGRPTGAGIPVASNMAGAACSPGTQGKTGPRGLPSGRVWKRNRRMQNGGRS